MSVRPKSSRKVKLKKLPQFDVFDALSQKANLELQLQEDKTFLDKMDFDPIHDAEKVTPKDNSTDYWLRDKDKIGPECFGSSDYDLDPATYTPIFSRDGFAEAEAVMKKFNQAREIPVPQSTDLLLKYTKGSPDFYPNEAWIQTYSGKRFTPTKPKADSIVIQDIAHALSMQCRFSGHVKYFYSVAQHCVLVSYICDQKDALWGLLHDATEAYLVDVPRPLKRSGKFGAYMEAEKVMQNAICERFSLPLEEPESVHKADTILLSTEARDLMFPLRPDWVQPVKPLPFKIEPLGPREAKLQYLQRFFELIGSPNDFDRYLEHEFHGTI